jgi:hypothetical protein
VSKNLDHSSPYGNIDHVVISQFGGIILLETKSHHGTVTTTDNQILVNGDEPEKDFVGLALKNSYWLREEVERLIHVKPWITPIVVFTNAFVKFGKTPKGVRVINQKFLLRTLQSSHSNSSANTIVWENHDLIAAFLSGQQPNPISETDTQVHCCPKCGKRMVEKLAKGGSQVGKRFWVCPDYPSCKTAIPID